MFRNFMMMLVGLIAFASVAEAATVTARTYTNSSSWYIDFAGKIEAGDLAKLQRAYNSRAGIPNNIFFNSGGGNVGEAHAIAQWIRSRNLNTAIYHGDRCASACTDAFMGGKNRKVGRNARVGFHPGMLTDITSYTAYQAYDMGQTAAMRDALFFSVYVAAGKEYHVVKFLSKVYSGTAASSMYWANYNELYEAGIATGRY